LKYGLLIVENNYKIPTSFLYTYCINCINCLQNFSNIEKNEFGAQEDTQFSTTITFKA